MPAQKMVRKAPRKKPALAKKPAKRRQRTGVKALREIKRYQKTTELLVPRAPFVRLLRGILFDLSKDMRIQASAVSALQEAAETTLVREFEMTQLAAIHAKRVTIQQKDMKLVQAMRLHMTGFSFPGNNV
ncbi:hypothetical protein GMDG_08613 [Pseudogymnoascus destructans 20631-21]|uniref:Core Histone H2A/H2B/H3 domain-containing protein n=2 Tax=Pseudogymnoascus destructans TaxID=655981 RepID=L8G670_PSED2|nr:hypothetical protein GMDG_08613 [Pseudogymnoascus destructans 20631-21]